MEQYADSLNPKNKQSATFMRYSTIWFATLACIQLLVQIASAQGIVVPGVGPINRSMAGAATAAPLDAAGALHWNPATISALPSSQMMFGAEFIYPRTTTSSAIPPGSLGGGLPPVAIEGENLSQAGVSVLPSTALVYRGENRNWSAGIGLFAVGGFGANYPGSQTNPILTPPPPNGFSTGPIFSNFALSQVTPTVAVQVSPHISIGFAPTVSIASLTLSPAIFGSPDDANGNGTPTYPAAANDRLRWGLGFQAGIYITTEHPWSFGASIKSPQWFEDFEFTSTDELGVARRLSLEVEFPMILSWGISYSGWQNTLAAVDFRYVDYQNASTLGDPAGFRLDGSLSGLGWDSVFAVAAGLHHEFCDHHSARIGYLFTENPISPAVASLNVAAPAIYQHALYLGSSSRLSNSLSFAWSYYHAFRSSVSGPLLTPLGPVPGSEVRIRQDIDALIAGFYVDF